MSGWTAREERLCTFLSKHSQRYRAPSPTVLLYVISAALTLFSCLMVQAEYEVIGVATHFPAYVALILAIRLCGRGPAWLSVVVATLGIMWFIPPPDSFAVATEEVPRLLNNICGMTALVTMWPRRHFGDMSYRLLAIQRRAIESIRRQNSSSSSAIGRASIASRSTIKS
jgi:hypothetical protein